MKAFFASLSRGTKITLITCGCFIMLTMLILIFLMLCPIQQTDAVSNEALLVTETTTTTGSTTEVTTTSTENTTSTRITTTTTVSTEAYQNWGYVETDWYDYSVDPSVETEYVDNEYVYADENDETDRAVETEPADADVNTFAAEEAYADSTETYTEPVAVQTEEAIVTDAPSDVDGLTDGGIAVD